MMITPEQYGKLWIEKEKQQFETNTFKRLLIAILKSRGGKMEINRLELEDSEPDNYEILMWKDNDSSKWIFTLKSGKNNADSQ